MTRKDDPLLFLTVTGSILEMPALGLFVVLTGLLFLCFSNSVFALAQRAEANAQIGKQYRKQQGVTEPLRG